MKRLYDPAAVNEIMNRIEKLTPDTQRVWGRMNVAQMLAHTGNTLEMAMGKINPPRSLIGRLIGGFFKSSYTNDKPFSQGSPTSDELRIMDARNFLSEKERLLTRLKEFSSGGEAGCTRHPHPFFGELTPEEWGIGMYKHLDHHLRQFGV